MENYPIAIPVEEALGLILKRCAPLDSESVALEEADDRVLAEDVVARENIPPFPRSPYDGYALRAADTQTASKEQGVTLRIIEEVPAGHAPERCVGVGEATKILTGAPIPEGADVVVKFEDTEFTAETVTLFAPCKSGDNIVPAGEDIQLGDTVVARGTVLDGALLGILAGLGYTEVTVKRRPRVELISTGDELVSAGEPLAPGQIRNSSVYTLASYVRRCGAQAHCVGIVPDRAQPIADAIAAAAQNADLVLTTGGVSVGDYDMLRRALELLDAEILFWKVRMKPGSAFVAAVYKGTLILCLSGNPSAAVVAFFLLGIPALRKLEGCGDVELRKSKVRLARHFKKKSPNRRFLPGRLLVRDGEAYLEQAEKQGNGMLHPLHGCTLLGELPAGSPPMEAGSMIEAYWLFD